MSDVNSNVLVGISTNATCLFKLAKEASTRTDSAPSDKEPGQDDALVAVILCAATVEVFINDVIGVARFLCSENDGTQEPPEIQNFVAILEEVKETQGSVELKYTLAKTLLSGRPYNKGTNPCQDFIKLIKLRNSLIHLKPAEFESADDGEIKGKEPPVVKGLPKHLLCDKKTVSWIGKINNRAVARWACNTTVSMVLSFVDCVPSSKLRQNLEQIRGPALNNIWQPISGGNE